MSSIPAMAPGGAASCWNCRPPLQRGAERCLWCGVPLQAAPAAAAPAAAQPAAAPQAAPVQQAPRPGAVAPVASPPPRGTIALDPHFSGSAAGVGAQVAAFTVDAVLVAVIVVATALVSRSALLASLAGVEAVVILWVMLARAGSSPGHALLRLRVSRDDAPYSPGSGRAFVRGLVTNLGLLVAGVGAWVVTATGVGDVRSRSWADRAARTQVVAVPRRNRSVPVRVPVYTQPAAGVQLDYGSAPAPVILAAPQVVSTSARQATVDEVSASASQTGARGSESVVVAPMPEPTSLPAEVQATVRKEGVSATVLLVFDSGQREELTPPVAVNLGRSPAASEPGDRLIAVREHESTVSKTHARLEHSRGTTWITDFGSTNGTDLLTDEGETIPLAPNVRTLLEEGSRVRVGNRVFTVSVLLGGE